jgi:hypothetical protein
VGTGYYIIAEKDGYSPGTLQPLYFHFDIYYIFKKKTMNKSNLLVFLIAIVSYSCSDPAITDDLLDGNVIFDPSLYNPEQFLVSEKYPNPTASDLDKHIILAVHGYSATTFEWQNLQTGQLRLLPINFAGFIGWSRKRL